MTTPTDTVRLHHFTSRWHLQRIQQAGYVRTTAPNVQRVADPDEPWTNAEIADLIRYSPVNPTTGERLILHTGTFRDVTGVPKVVWTTNDPNPANHLWMGRGSWKSEVRLDLEIPTDWVLHWPTWSRQMGIHEECYQSLATSGGDPKTWFVIPRRIPLRYVRAAIDPATGRSVGVIRRAA